MAKFYGVIGYATMVEKSPGVWVEEITERTYRGDVIRNTRRLQSTEHLNDDVTVSNEISVIADPFAISHFHLLRYVGWMGAKWKVSNIEVQHPRMLLTLGGVYNGE